MGAWPFASLYVAEAVATAHFLFAYMLFSVSHWVKECSSPSESLVLRMGQRRLCVCVTGACKDMVFFNACK